MNKKTLIKPLIAILLVGLTAQVGFAAYSKWEYQPEEVTEVSSLTDTSTTTETTTTTDTQTSQEPNTSDVQEEDTVNTEVSAEIQALIKESDPLNFSKNMTNYKNLLMDFNVHTKLKEEIEGLIQAGHKLPDILSGYEYLYHAYGTVAELEVFVEKKATGTNWNQIFSEYNKTNKIFIPRAFEPDYLEKLMETPGITSDDIMLADRISFEAGLEFEALINRRMEGESWKTIGVKANILNTASVLPRVEVTMEILEKYTTSTGLGEDEVVEALVLAQKLDNDVEGTISQIKSGIREEVIFEKYLMKKYY